MKPRKLSSLFVRVLQSKPTKHSDHTKLGLSVKQKGRERTCFSWSFMKDLWLSVRFPEVVFWGIFQIYSEVDLTSTGWWCFHLAADWLIIFSLLSRMGKTVLLHRKVFNWDVPSSTLIFRMLNQLLNYEELYWQKKVVSSEQNRGHFLFNQVVYQKKFTFKHDRKIHVEKISGFFASTSFQTHTRKVLCFSSNNSDHIDCQSCSK